MRAKRASQTQPKQAAATETLYMPSDEQLQELFRDTPTEHDKDAVVYPRRKRFGELNMADDAPDSDAYADTKPGETPDDYVDASGMPRLIGDSPICQYYHFSTYPTGIDLEDLGFNYDPYIMLPPPSEPQWEEGGIDLNLIQQYPGGFNTAEEYARAAMDAEEDRRYRKLVKKYQQQMDLCDKAKDVDIPYVQHTVEHAETCEEFVGFASYNPFDRYQRARALEGERATAQCEAMLNPYGGYLGEEDAEDVSYGPYQEIESYIPPGVGIQNYIRDIYSDSTMTDSDSKQIAQILEGIAARPSARVTGSIGVLPGERDPTIAGAGIGATLCTSHFGCEYPGHPPTGGACSICNPDPDMCRFDNCAAAESGTDADRTCHPPSVYYVEQKSEAMGEADCVERGDIHDPWLFMSRVDQCYYACVRKEIAELGGNPGDFTEDDVRDICHMQRCLPAYCLEHGVKQPEGESSETPENPREALNSFHDVCTVAWVLANGYGVDDICMEWWKATTVKAGGAGFREDGYVIGGCPGTRPGVTPHDECDQLYGNWPFSCSVAARVVTQLAIWAVQTDPTRTKVYQRGVFVDCPTGNIPGGCACTWETAPFHDTLDAAFKFLVDGATEYVESSDCISEVQGGANKFTGPSGSGGEFPTGDLDRSLSAYTPYPPRSLRDQNLPVVSNCSADAQSITACATDTTHLFWTALPNEIRVVCGRVLVGPFRLHSTRGSAYKPKWDVKNTCGCNMSDVNEQWDEVKEGCTEDDHGYHTTACSKLFSFTDNCGNPVCCDPGGPFEDGLKNPGDPCLDQDFYIAVRITGRYMCFTMCVEVYLKQVAVMFFPGPGQNIGARCPNLQIIPEVACMCVCVGIQQEPPPELMPPPAIFPPPPPPVYTRPPRVIGPQPFLIAPPPPPPPKYPEFPPPIVIPPPPVPPPLPPRIIQPVITPPPPPPPPPEQSPACPPIVVQPPPACPVLPSIPGPAPVIVAPPMDMRKPILMPPMPPMPQMPPQPGQPRGVNRPVRQPASYATQFLHQNVNPWPQGAPPVVNGVVHQPCPPQPQR